MSINNQEILEMLGAHEPKRQLSAVIQRSQELIRQIMDEQDPNQTKDLISIARDFKELVKLNEDELKLRYLSVKYPDFKFNIKGFGVHAGLSMYPYNKVKTILEFPPGLESLRIDNYVALSLPELPFGLKELDMLFCPSIERISKLPSSLEKLEINGFYKLEALPVFPSSLTMIRFDNCPNLESIGKFPSSLKYLDIFDCENLEAIPDFPSSLESLYIKHCPKLTQETLSRIKEFNYRQT